MIKKNKIKIHVSSIKFLFFSAILILLINSVYSNTILENSSLSSITQITEINFQNNEYIEIYSTQSLNLTNATIKDENTGENSLELIKTSNSNFYLIVGTHFLEEYKNLNQFNCTIYTTPTTSPGKHGLKNTGENIFIEININQSLNFTKEIPINFKINETLNFKINESNYFKTVQNICIHPIMNIINQSNTNNTIININSSNQINELELTPTIQNNTIDKLNITLNTNSSNVNISMNTSTNISNTDITTNTSLNNNSNNIYNNIYNNNSNNSFNIFSCNNTFQINIKNKIFRNKIEYNFKTDLNDFTIEYWIEDYENNIVRNKRITYNLNTKSYTPKKQSNIYKINAVIKSLADNCTIKTNETIFFYSKQSEITSNNQKQASLCKLRNKKTPLQDSYIKIPNTNNILNSKDNFLQYEIYRGNTAKRTLNFYLDKEKLASIELEKYSKLKGKLSFKRKNKPFQILITGLDIEEKIIVYPPEYNLLKKPSKTKEKALKSLFKLDNISLNSDLIEYTINKTKDNLSLECYITYIRTKVSPVKMLKTQKNQKSKEKNQLIKIIQEINNTKLQNKAKLKTYPLKLNCKYKKLNQVTYNYIHKEFNYTINSKQTNKIKPKKKNKVKINSPNLNNTKQSKNIYTSNNFKLKESSFFPAFAGTVLLLSIFIVKR